jgi:hypothetical protein
MLTIIDDYSRRVFSYFLKHKSDAFDAFKAWKVMVETVLGRGCFHNMLLDKSFTFHCN